MKNLIISVTYPYQSAYYKQNEHARLLWKKKNLNLIIFGLKNNIRLFTCNYSSVSG